MIDHLHDTNTINDYEAQLAQARKEIAELRAALADAIEANEKAAAACLAVTTS